MKREIDLFQVHKLYVDQSGLCHYCFHDLPADKIQVEHKIPRSKGGSDNMDNLVLSCKSCNSKKGVRSYEEYKSMTNNYVLGLCTYENIFEYNLYLRLKTKYE